MPKIQDYNPQVSTPGPVNSQEANPEAFGSGIAQGVEKLGQGVQYAGQVLQRRKNQVSVANANLGVSQVYSDTETYVNDMLQKAKPDDPELVENVRGFLAQKLDKLEEDSDTQASTDYLARQRKTLEEHFLRKTIDAQTKLQGVADEQKFHVALHNFSAPLVQDPSLANYQTAHDQTMHAIETFSGTHGMNPEQKIKAQEFAEKDLAVSRIEGLIKQDPKQAKEVLKSDFAKNLDGPTVSELMDRADARYRANDLETERQWRLKKEHLEDAANHTMDGLLQRMYKGKLSTDDILDAPGLTNFPNRKKEMINWLESKMGETKENPNPAEFNETMRRVHLDADDPEALIDPRDVYSRAQAGLISWKQAEYVTEKMKNSTEYGQHIKTWQKELLKLGSTLNASGPTGKDPDGAKREGQFNQFWMDAGEDAKKQGIPLSEIWNPKSPKYVGNALDYFRGSLNEKMQAMSREMRPASNPNNPYDYLRQGINAHLPPAFGGLQAAPTPAPGARGVQATGQAAPSATTTAAVPTGLPPQVLTDVQKRYNAILLGYGGTKDQAFGPRGEFPAGGVNNAAALKAKYLIDQENEFSKEDTRQKEMNLAQIRGGTPAELAAKADTERVKNIEKQNEGLRALGLPELPTGKEPDRPAQMEAKDWDRLSPAQKVQFADHFRMAAPKK